MSKYVTDEAVSSGVRESPPTKIELGSGVPVVWMLKLSEVEDVAVGASKLVKNVSCTSDVDKVISVGEALITVLEGKTVTSAWLEIVTEFES